MTKDFEFGCSIRLKSYPVSGLFKNRIRFPAFLKTGSGSATYFFSFSVAGFTRHLGPVHSVSYGNLFLTATTPTASTHSQPSHLFIPSLLIPNHLYPATYSRLSYPHIPSPSFPVNQSQSLIPKHSFPATHHKCHMGTISVQQQHQQHPLIPSPLIPYHSFPGFSSTHSLSLFPVSLIHLFPAILFHMGSFSAQQQHQQHPLIPSSLFSYHSFPAFSSIHSQSSNS